MEEKQKKEEQKRIARECLRNFRLMDQVQEQFMTEDKLFYSERHNQIFDGVLYWLSNKPEWLEKVHELEQEYGVLVYHAYLYRATYGTVLDCLCVPSDLDAFEDTLEDSKNGIAFIYAINLSEPLYSEFGYGEYKPKNGGISKTA